MQPIQFRFTYTEEEYLAAARLMLLGNNRTVARLVVCFVLLILIFVLLSMLVGPVLPFWASVALSLLFILALSYKLLTDVPRRYFRGDPKFRDEYALTFSDEGVSVQTREIDSKMGWGLYSGVTEGRDLYLIMYGKDTRMMTVVPKRLFVDANQELEFRRLLRVHVDHDLPVKQIDGKAEEREYVPSRTGPPDWR
jgi:hypothetical protein